MTTSTVQIKQRMTAILLIICISCVGTCRASSSEDANKETYADVAMDMIPLVGAGNRFRRGEYFQGFFNLGMDALALFSGGASKAAQGARLAEKMVVKGGEAAVKVVAKRSVPKILAKRFVAGAGANAVKALQKDSLKRGFVNEIKK